MHEPGSDRWTHRVPLLRLIMPTRCMRCRGRWPCRLAWHTTLDLAWLHPVESASDSTPGSER
jgi:hypothetical protein